MKITAERLPELRGAENLGRTVVSSSAAKRATANGTVIRDVFLEAPAAPSISVDRMDHAERTVMAELAVIRASNRKPPRRFHGWAVLTIDEAQTGGRTVEATPTNENPFHADIHLNIDSHEVRDAQKEHALQLAAQSLWVPAPRSVSSG